MTDLSSGLGTSTSVKSIHDIYNNSLNYTERRQESIMQQHCTNYTWMKTMTNKRKHNKYHSKCKWSQWLIGSLTTHSIVGGRSYRVLWPPSRQQAYSIPEAVALIHVGSRPHHSPHALLFASTTNAPNCMDCYSLQLSLASLWGRKAELAKFADWQQMLYPLSGQTTDYQSHTKFAQPRTAF